MNKLTLLAALSVATLALPALAEDARQDFTLVNRTGYSFNEAYLAPANSDEWQEDFLGKYQLEDGDAKKVHFNPKTKTCHWDLKVVYTEDQSKVIWRNLNLCNTDTITIYYDRKSETTSAKFD